MHPIWNIILDVKAKTGPGNNIWVDTFRSLMPFAHEMGVDSDYCRLVEAVVDKSINECGYLHEEVVIVLEEAMTTSELRRQEVVKASKPRKVRKMRKHRSKIEAAPRDGQRNPVLTVREKDVKKSEPPQKASAEDDDSSPAASASEGKVPVQGEKVLGNHYKLPTGVKMVCVDGQYFAVSDRTGSEPELGHAASAPGYMVTDPTGVIWATRTPCPQGHEDVVPEEELKFTKPGDPKQFKPPTAGSFLPVLPKMAEFPSIISDNHQAISSKKWDLDTTFRKIKVPVAKEKADNVVQLAATKVVKAPTTPEFLLSMPNASEYPELLTVDQKAVLCENWVKPIGDLKAHESVTEPALIPEPAPEYALVADEDTSKPLQQDIEDIEEPVEIAETGEYFPDVLKAEVDIDVVPEIPPVNTAGTVVALPDGATLTFPDGSILAVPSGSKLTLPPGTETLQELSVKYVDANHNIEPISEESSDIEVSETLKGPEIVNDETSEAAENAETPGRPGPVLPLFRENESEGEDDSDYEYESESDDELEYVSQHESGPEDSWNSSKNLNPAVDAAVSETGELEETDNLEISTEAPAPDAVAEPQPAAIPVRTDENIPLNMVEPNSETIPELIGNAEVTETSNPQDTGEQELTSEVPNLESFSEPGPESLVVNVHGDVPMNTGGEEPVSSLDNSARVAVLETTNLPEYLDSGLTGTSQDVQLSLEGVIVRDFAYAAPVIVSVGSTSEGVSSSERPLTPPTPTSHPVSTPGKDRADVLKRSLYELTHTFIGTTCLVDYLKDLACTKKGNADKTKICSSFIGFATKESALKGSQNGLMIPMSKEAAMDYESFVQKNVKLGNISLHQFLQHIAFKEGNKTSIRQVVRAFKLLAIADRNFSASTVPTQPNNCRRVLELLHSAPVVQA